MCMAYEFSMTKISKLYILFLDEHIYTDLFQ
jgi:hypothetical protein